MAIGLTDDRGEVRGGALVPLTAGEQGPTPELMIAISMLAAPSEIPQPAGAEIFSTGHWEPNRGRLARRLPEPGSSSLRTSRWGLRAGPPRRRPRRPRAPGDGECRSSTVS